MAQKSGIGSKTSKLFLKEIGREGEFRSLDFIDIPEIVLYQHLVKLSEVFTQVELELMLFSKSENTELVSCKHDFLVKRTIMVSPIVS